MSEDTANSTLLTYAVISDPDPLQVSSTAKLTIIVSNDTNDYVNVTSIVFELPVGTYAKDLTSDPSSIQSTVPDDWGISQEAGRFIATPNTPNAGKVGPVGLWFTLSDINVNAQVGTAPLGIREDTEKGGIREHASIPLGKFPAGFTVSPLNADPLIIGPGKSTILSWSGSQDANYTLQYQSASKENMPATDSYPVSNLQATTTFYLIVTATAVDQTAQIQRERTVTVQRAQITSFNAPPGVIFVSQPAQLTWTTSGATSCELYANGILIDGNAPLSATEENPYTVRPTSTTTYRLVAKDTNSQTSASKELTVSVQGLKFKTDFVIEGAHQLAGAAVSPDGSRLYVIDIYKPGRLWIVDASDYQSYGSVNVGVEPINVAISPDGSRVYVTEYASNTVSIINGSETKPTSILASVKVGSAPLGVAVSPDSAYVYVSNSGSNTVSVIETSTNKVVRTVPVGSLPNGVSVSPDGSRVYVSINNTNQVSVIDTSAQPDQLMQTVPLDYSPTWILTAPDGSCVYVVNRNSSESGSSNCISAIDISTAANPSVLEVVVQTQDQRLAHYYRDAQTGQWHKTAEFGGNITSAPSLAVSPFQGLLEVVAQSGQRLVHYYRNKNFKWWKTAEFGGNTTSAPSLAVNPILDGNLAVVVQSQSRLVQYYRPPHGEWQKTEEFGDDITSAGALSASPTDGHLEVIAQTQGKLVHYYRNVGGPWQKAEEFGENITSAPSRPYGWYLDVVVQSQGELVHYYRNRVDNQYQWHKTAEFGENITSSPSLAVSQFSPRLQVVAQSQDKIVHYYRDDSNHWQKVAEFGDDITSAPSLFARPDIMQGVTTKSIGNIFGSIGVMGISPDGAHLYVASDVNNSVLVIDSATLEIIQTVTVGDNPPLSLAVSPDGLYVYALFGYSNKVAVLEIGLIQPE